MAYQEVGRRGEDLAAQHLEGLGWRLLERNWRCRAGEIDIIAAVGGSVVFVEVKCRRGTGFGDPLEAITVAKVAKMRELAQVWLRQHPGIARSVRIDAIGVLLAPRNPPVLTHVRGVGQ